MFSKIKRRLRSDRADSELVSLVILLPLVVGLLFTMIDSAIYFSNRSMMNDVARDGARTVAIMGGNGTSTQETTIERQYGTNRLTACDLGRFKYLDKNATLLDPNFPMIKDALTDDSTAIECNMMFSLEKNTSLINTTVSSVKCSPILTTTIGDRTSCSIQWTYQGVPGSALTFIRSSGGGSGDCHDRGLESCSLTIGTSTAEVALDSTSLVPRAAGN